MATLLALVAALAVVAPASTTSGTARTELLRPLADALGEGHAHAIALYRQAGAGSPAAGDDEHGAYLALVDAELALAQLSDAQPPALQRGDIAALRNELGDARDALADYAAARSGGRRVDMREAAEGLRDALGRAAAVVDAAREAPAPDQDSPLPAQ